MNPFRECDLGPRSMLRKAIRLFVFCIVGFSMTPTFGQGTDFQEEKIVFYGSEVDIDTSGTVHVTETIKVRTLGQDIKRGIFRTLPTEYKGKFNETVIISLAVTQVLRDGKPEEYFEEESGNGKVIYIGNEYVQLPPGEYTYTIAYTVDKQIGFFDEYDEFYWNVTGLDWKFKIDSVYAIVNLPPGGSILNDRLAAYSGPAGATGCNCTIVPVSATSAAFHTTRQLSGYEGLTIAVPFEKGLLTPPTWEEKRDRFIKDNFSGVIAVIGLAVVLVYYIVAWLLVGIDPPGRVIMPRYEPPAGLAPYELRYVKKSRFDNQTMVAALVWMAQNGNLTLAETGKRSYTLTPGTNPNHKPSEVEQTMIDRFFSGGATTRLDKTYNPAFAEAKKVLGHHLKKNFRESVLRLNRPWITIGILLSVAAVICSVVQRPFIEAFACFFALFFLAAWSFFCYMLVRGFINTIREKKYVEMAVLTLFVVAFVGAEIFGIILLERAFNFYAYISIILLVLVNILFVWLLKAPTLHGRQLLDEIEGFSLFLRTAELSRMENLTTTLVMDLNLFQRYLPYAIALDLQTEWAGHFENNLANEAGTTTDRFRWHRSISTTGSLADFSSSLSSSLSSSISSSSTPPGSSSGSRGSSGGSSGGGGGGGGGGGW